MAISIGDICLRPIQSDDNSSKLSLGHESFTPLKIFLKNHAFDFNSYEIAKTYVIVHPNQSRIFGYITLLASEVVLNEEQRPQESPGISRYEVFPAIKLARLAVDKSLHGQGVGRQLLMWALHRASFFIMPHIGCRFIIVDSKKNSVPFYQKVGFSLVNAEQGLEEFPLMFFDLYKANHSLKVFEKHVLLPEIELV